MLETQPGTAEYVALLRRRAVSGRADVAIFMTDMRLGGVQRVIFNLCEGLNAAGLRVDLLVCHADGNLAAQVPPGIRVVALPRASKLAGRYWVLRADPGGFAALLRPVLLAYRAVARLKFVRPLACYLADNRPPALLAADTDCNLIAVWARRLAKSPTRLVLSAHRSVAEHARQQLQAGDKGRWRWHFLPPLLKRCYAQADSVVAVSEGVARGLEAFCGLPASAAHIIYNPVVTPRLRTMARQPMRDAWVTGDSTPLIVTAGRVDPQKDFPTLLLAIAQLRSRRPVRLAILGDGERRNELARQTVRLGIADIVHFAGFVENPFAYMAAADVFVLSSKFEGLPTVLIEAMACGCPVVSTDCPSGPREILADGRYGELVPVGDAAALAAAIGRTLDRPADAQRLAARADEFSPEKATVEYLRVLASA
ncbi:MAG: glycosyltransferase [Nitrococcus mobilis]|nr:glycosyltransferase [Nitrococcus mobilis]